MNTCEVCRDYIEQYKQGTIADVQLTELKRHTEICDVCNKEFEQCCLMWEIIKKALEPATGAEEAKKALLERLSEDDLPRS